MQAPSNPNNSDIPDQSGRVKRSCFSDLATRTESQLFVELLNLLWKWGTTHKQPSSDPYGCPTPGIFGRTS